jgi:hypothetical protein
MHERLGARVATPIRKSLQITGTVAEWETWTGMGLILAHPYRWQRSETRSWAGTAVIARRSRRRLGG